jgi:hypothetical protein
MHALAHSRLLDEPLADIADLPDARFGLLCSAGGRPPVSPIARELLNEQHTQHAP